MRVWRDKQTIGKVQSNRYCQKKDDWSYCTDAEISVLSLAARVGGERFPKGKKIEWNCK